MSHSSKKKHARNRSNLTENRSELSRFDRNLLGFGWKLLFIRPSHLEKSVARAFSLDHYVRTIVKSEPFWSRLEKVLVLFLVHVVLRGR